MTTPELNGDGLVDVVVAMEETVSVFLNLAEGNLAATDYQIPGDEGLQLSDLDGDGFLDLIGVDRDRVTVSLNSSHGTFSEVDNYELETPLNSWRIEDVNGDSRPDLLTFQDKTMSVFLNLGQGSFAPSSDYLVGNFSQNTQITLSDLNQDGLVDVLITNDENRTFSVLFNLGSGSFAAQLAGDNSEYPVGDYLQDVTLRDLNLDGELDLLAVVRNEVLVSLGNGDGTFYPYQSSELNFNVGKLWAIGDFHNDGNLDLILSPNLSFRNSNSLFLPGLGDSTFGQSTELEVLESADAVTAADINNDDLLDLIVGTGNNLSVVLGDGSGNFVREAEFTLSERIRDLAVGDADGDGVLDLVVTDSGGIEVWLGNSNGSFNFFHRVELKYGGKITQLEDLNQDGVLDLLVTNYTNRVAVLLGNGDGSFELNNTYKVGNGLEDLAVGDVNGDSVLDILTANQYDDTVSILFGVGDGTFTSPWPRDFLVGERPVDLALGNLDGDGRLDLVTANDWDDTVSVRLNGKLLSQETGERTYTYDPIFNQVTSFTDELGRTTLYEIDPNTGNQLSVTRVVGEIGGDDDVVTSYTYTPSGLIDTITEPLGRVTDYDYNELARLVKITFALGTVDEAIQQFEYDLAGNQTAIIDADGNRTEYEYDARNRLVRTVLAVGTSHEAVQSTEYDRAGNQVATVDSNGNRTEFEYDALNRLVRIVAPDPDGAGPLTSPITTYSYDGAGNLLLIADPLERKTEYVYDSRNRLVSTILPDGSVISSSYDFDNNPTVSLDGNGNRTRSFYDSRGRLTGSIDAVGNETSYQYDAANQLVAVVDANGHRTQYEYDELGRQVAVIDAAGNVSRTEYDKAGNVVAEIDANGNTTYFQYDALNRQIAVTDAEGGTTSTTYDRNGNVLSITDPVNNRTSYIYDARNRLVSETNQLGHTRSFEYDGVGNRLSTTDRNGRVREFTYDGLNRLISENWLDTVGNTIRTISNSYDAASQLIAVRDPDSSYSYSYDELRRLLTIDNGGTPGVSNVVLTYSYDGNGNITEVRDAIDGEAAGITTYTYDELDRVTQITQTGNEVADKRVDFRYDAIGQIELISRYSDLDGTELVVGSDYTYDELNRLTNLTHSNNTSTVAFYDFVYDGASRITQITDIDGVTDYSYDDRNQLTGAERSDSNNPDESYSYDANGNRLSSSFHEDDYVTGGNNQLESDGIYNYEYDLEGNLIRQTEIATGAVREFEWDYRNRLVTVVDEDALAEVTQSVSYTYDALNRRISKTVDGIVTYFVHDSYDSLSNVALEFGDEDGVAGSAEPVLTQRYVHGSRVDQVLAQEDGDGNLLWHLGDHLGTIRDLVDSSGELMNHYIYDSFGNVIAQTDNTVENRYLFTGREFDFKTGLYYYRARYYYSPTGRFLGLDPIGFGGEDWNLYRYVGNSPLNGTDPTGQFKVELRYRKAVLKIQLYHADIVVTDKNGMRAYWAGPRHGFLEFSPLGIFTNGSTIGFFQNTQNYGPGARFFVSNPNFIQVVYDDDTDCPNQELESKIIQAFQQINNARIPYHPSGPNSNSSAFHVLRSTGIGYPRPPKGITAPGWEVNPFTAYQDRREEFQRGVLEDMRQLGFPQ